MKIDTIKHKNLLIQEEPFDIFKKKRLGIFLNIQNTNLLHIFQVIMSRAGLDYYKVIHNFTPRGVPNKYLASSGQRYMIDADLDIYTAINIVINLYNGFYPEVKYSFYFSDVNNYFVLEIIGDD